MKDCYKISVEEWASENNITLSDEQVLDLCDAIDMCHEMMSYQTGWSPGHRPKTQQDIEIEKLKKQVYQLERFCDAKGYSVAADENGVTHYYMETSCDHRASRRDRYSY